MTWEKARKYLGNAIHEFVVWHRWGVKFENVTLLSLFIYVIESERK